MTKTNAERQREWRERHPGLGLQRRVQIKREVLTHYGADLNVPMCIKCGEIRLACLSIDHIHGGGNKERGVHYSSTSFYIGLRRKGFPMGYQTLCMNCNFVKRFERGEHNHHPVKEQ